MSDYLWSFPADSGLQLQLSHGEVVVHEQTVPPGRADVADRRRTPGHDVGEPEAGLRTEQLVGADRVRVILRQRRGAAGLPRQLSHVKLLMRFCGAVEQTGLSFLLMSADRSHALCDAQVHLSARCGLLLLVRPLRVFEALPDIMDTWKNKKHRPIIKVKSRTRWNLSRVLQNQHLETHIY